MQSFHVKFPALWRQTFPALVLGAVCARLWQWVHGEPFSIPQTMPLAGVAAVMVLLVHYLQPTLAGPGGVKAMNVWGFRSFLRWDAIAEASFGRYLLQPSIKLVDRRGRRYWIARETKNLQALHRLAAEFGGSAHPLKRILETPLHSL
jgi:hypothetical protein